MSDAPVEADLALAELLRHLHSLDYSFVTVTPATHARVLARRAGALAQDLRDALGWSLPFRRGTLDAKVERLLAQAGAVRGEGDLVRAAVRVSELDGRLFLHSSFPTSGENAVFFGPDSYRFARSIEAEMARRPITSGHIVDMGAGSGVGGIVAGAHARHSRVTLTDVNPDALRLARINAEVAGVAVTTRLTGDLQPTVQPADLVLANPPYIIDAQGRAYRDGGDLYGGGLALEMARQAIGVLAPKGRLLLYTGASIVGGRNLLGEALEELARQHALCLTSYETDPDVFGEELSSPAYADVERIALMLAVFEAA